MERLLFEYDYPHGDTAFTNAFSWRKSIRTAIGNICGITVLRFLISPTEYAYLPIILDPASIACSTGAATPGGTSTDIPGGTSTTAATGITATAESRTTTPTPLFEELMKNLREEALHNGNKLILADIKPSLVPIFRELLPTYAFWHHRDSSDYIFLAENLKTLKGNKYQQKRNHFNKFKSLYNFEYKVLGPDMVSQCTALERTWYKEHQEREARTHETAADNMISDERTAVAEALANYTRLGLTGGALFVDGKMVAFTYGSRISDNTFCVHIEKGDTSYEGIFAAINKLFAEHLPPEITYIDREEDMGLPGLRFSKSSYHPIRLAHRILGTELAPKELAVRRLWLEAFEEDTPEDADLFLKTHYSPERMLSIEDPEQPGELASMLHIVPFGETAYIYAVATAKNRRGRGYATRLIKEALEKSKQEGYLYAALIPSNNTNREWYRNMGFSPQRPAAESASGSTGAKATTRATATTCAAGSAGAKATTRATATTCAAGSTGAAAPQRFIGADGYDFGTGGPEDQTPLYITLNKTIQ